MPWPEFFAQKFFNFPNSFLDQLIAIFIPLLSFSARFWFVALFCILKKIFGRPPIHLSPLVFFLFFFFLKMRWNLEGPISSGYLVHCSHPFFIWAFAKSFRRPTLCYLRILWHRLPWPGCLFKLWVLSVSSETLMPVIAILIPVADCVLLLHQLVIRLVTINLMYWFLNAYIILNALH